MFLTRPYRKLVDAKLKLIQAGLTNEVAEMLRSISTLKKVKSKATILNIGERCNTGFFIVQGEFIIQYINPETGKENTINFFMDELNPFMSISESYFSGELSKYQIKALSPSVVLTFKKKAIDQLKNSHKNFQSFYNNRMAKALVEESILKNKLISLSSKQFYCFLANERPQIIQKVPHKYIAEFMGISREHLSRIKKISF